MFLTLSQFHVLLLVMTILAIGVFISLFFVEAGYGKLISPQWGPTLSNKLAWMLMECPVFFIMLWFWSESPRQWNIAPLLFFIFFELHYSHRAFMFPLLIKGKSRMPLAIVLMGVVFNVINGYIQGEWIFFLAPEEMYTAEWLTTPKFIVGSIIFLMGMLVNWQSDYIIRHLRKANDTKHYLPKHGMYRYVTSANYFGEIVEWIGFAILTWSLAGAVFAIWTMANLVPRANSIYKKYQQEFGDEFYERPLKRVFPFIY